MDTYYIGLGSNMGDSMATISEAVYQLGQLPQVKLRAVSSLYETPPWGKTDQDTFVNAVAVIETSMAPETLLTACLNIEALLGRIRHEKWGARTIDLDLLYSPTRVVQTTNLILPHPYITDRAFVLVPLKEVAPELILFGRPIDEYLSLLRADAAQIKVVATLEIPEVS